MTVPITERTPRPVPITVPRPGAGYAWYSQGRAVRPRRSVPLPHSASSAQHWKDRAQGAFFAIAGVTISEVFFDGTVATIIRWLGGLL